MASKGLIILNFVLILRILTLLFCVASIVLIVTNEFKYEGARVKFTHVIAFRYILASGAVGLLYALIQIPFAFYHAYTQKRWIRDGYLHEFDFYGDKIVSMLLATGVGVGFGASAELKRLVDGIYVLIQLLKIPGFDVDEWRSNTNKFLNQGILSTGLLLGAFTCMLALTILTSKARSK
ncbi:hypothetical protein LIER_39708 [Lithospermum erythrorhizon]|uniref:CASP-like protein n=1 Tax=Lithospermum erythrorhizon TaxID=34254 RepID=A0AAV3QKH8_LITER